ncbi:MAG: protein kinase [Gemmatimonadales bacterium]
MDALGQRFQRLLKGRYSLDREIGRGGMATVYLARDLRHDREVAIKLLQPELTTPVTAERFLREINITAKLQHPHILTLIDSGAKDGLAYYVMPHVDGESLRDRLIWDKQLPVDRAVQIAREVASALGYAHERGVVHRDIKPENILLSAGHAIVADFGIARAVRDSNQQAITQVGLPLGTPAYMSPEQAAGREDVDHRADLYSLGCVLFEMLAGRAPFVAPTVSKVLAAHLNQPAPAVTDHCSGAPIELDRVLKRALAKEPGERFQTAGEFVEALELIGAVETLERKTPTGARRSITPPQTSYATHEGTPFGLKQLLILGGLIGAVVLAVVGVRALLQEPPPPPPAPGVIDPAATAPSFLSSIGLKPLEAIGNDSTARVASAGLTEEITAQLSRIKRLKVISRTTMEAVRDREWTSRMIADSLGLRFLLEGSVQRAGDQVAVTLQLIDATTDGHVWSDSYRMPIADLLMVRERIGMSVATALAEQAPGLAVLVPDSSSRNPLAVEARARGLDLGGTADPVRLDQAIGAFEEALELDPRYAEAAVDLSNMLRAYVDYGFAGDREPYQTLRAAARWADRAVALDPNSGPAYAARGAVRGQIGASTTEALADLDRAVALAPASGNVRVYRGIGLARAKRYEEALKELELAAQLDALNGAVRGGGYALTALGARRYDIAAREARRAAARDPGFAGWHVIELLALGLGGDWPACAAERLPDPGGPITALCLERVGRGAEATALVDSLVTEARAGRTSIYTIGLLGAYYAARGDAAEALAWLDRAFAVSPVAFDFRFFDSGLFEPVAGTPAFQQGLATVRARVRTRLGQAAGR